MSNGSQRKSTPPPFTPTVVRLPHNDFKISDAQFADLEAAGGVKLSERQRRSLQALADSWTEDLYIRRSARPKRFRECLDEMDDAFAGVEKACQWDDHPQYALVHWAMETSVKGAEGFPVRLSAFEVARGVKPGGTNAQSIANCDEALQRAGDATDTRRACRYVGQQGCRGAQPQRHCHTEGWSVARPDGHAAARAVENEHRGVARWTYAHPREGLGPRTGRH